MKKIIGYGEIMMRLSPKDYKSIEEVNEFESYYGGTESNTLVTLASLNDKTTYITKLPNDSVGKGAYRHLLKYNVGVEGVVIGGDHLGIYFMEQGFAQKPSKVIYHRKNSAINSLNIEELDIDKIFDQANWFHVTGISLAISKNSCDLVLKLCEIAKSKNIIISFDFNYRSKLWTTIEAKPVYQQILKYVDICFGNCYDIKNFTNITGNNENEMIHNFLEYYDIKYLINTTRNLVSTNQYSYIGNGYSNQNNELKVYNTNMYNFEALDRIGSGDSFTAGVIHILNQNIDDINQALDFGIKCGVLKHFVKGDVLATSLEEIKNFNFELQDVKR